MHKAGPGPDKPVRRKSLRSYAFVYERAEPFGSRTSLSADKAAARIGDDLLDYGTSAALAVYPSG